LRCSRVWRRSGQQGAVLPAVGSGTLVVRLDAATNVTTDANNFVLSWGDQTGVGDNYGGSFDSVSGTQPVLVSSSLYGQPVIRFTSDYLRSSHTADLGADESIDQTYFFVTAGNTNPQNLFDTAPNVAGPLRFANPNRVAEQNNDAGGIPVTLTPKPPSNGTILTIRHDGDVGTNQRTWEGFVNGSSYPGSTNTEAGRRIRWFHPTVGATNLGTAGFFNGDVAEILVYQGVLTNADRQAVEAYLIEKYIPEPAFIGLAAFAGIVMLRRRASGGAGIPACRGGTYSTSRTRWAKRSRG
jgi:hypothetical protein